MTGRWEKLFYKLVEKKLIYHPTILNVAPPELTHIGHMAQLEQEKRDAHIDYYFHMCHIPSSIKGEDLLCVQEQLLVEHGRKKKKYLLLLKE